MEMNNKNTERKQEGGNTGIDDVEYADIYPSIGGELTIKTC